MTHYKDSHMSTCINGVYVRAKTLAELIQIVSEQAN